jgi:DNA processing protein
MSTIHQTPEFVHQHQSGAATKQLFYASDRSLLDRPCVAVIGIREASDAGIRRARRLARELVEAGVVVVSGLARGIDAAAHREAIARGGRTIGVIGTPLDRAYPAEHAELQALIAAEHLVVSPFAAGTRVTRASFPTRNRVMAALCQATVIVEAADGSGTLYQADACRRLGRSLFICASQATRAGLRWPQRFAGPHTSVLRSTEQVIEAVAVARRGVNAARAG